MPRRLVPGGRRQYAKRAKALYALWLFSGFFSSTVICVALIHS